MLRMLRPGASPLRLLGLAAVAALIISSGTARRAEAMTPINPAALPAVKTASDATITPVRFGGGGHGGGGHFGGFHGGGGHFGGFHAAPAFHGGGMRYGGIHYGGYHRHWGGGYYRPYYGYRHFHRRYYYGGYYPYYSYYHYPRRCRIIWTYYGPRRICRWHHWHRWHYPYRYW
ncbi:hypothetical protein [Bradyrhizobium guangdongense]|uniref:Sulfur globule protein n=1 Tax=Bradyrhizobium guangdongense TaxID=1325090 RepID=A0A410UYM9_9BRAD|nr:hypothetical protein [Bradyrhizobium guangdongense]QAU36562.1 hypothetical protein X265_01810 [Bradyrhizobium guangdongense]QOZ57614.1 hypothetical protein XH86_01810 [Bradyrhizobium guangdongense]GGI32439.1 hypothetical protein GCM10010987_69440 [Bradyrhizobium guangdongense]